jgi:hypothetical protein
MVSSQSCRNSDRPRLSPRVDIFSRCYLDGCRIPSFIPQSADASVQGETPIRLLAATKLLAPRRHRGGVGEPIVPEPTRIVVHPSVDIPESKRNLDVAGGLQSLRRYAAGVGGRCEQQPAPASSALSVQPKRMQHIRGAISEVPHERIKSAKLGKQLLLNLTPAQVRGFCREKGFYGVATNAFSNSTTGAVSSAFRPRRVDSLPALS